VTNETNFQERVAKLDRLIPMPEVMNITTLSKASRNYASGARKALTAVAQASRFT